ncbi:MAG: ABC transporter permease [Gemmatimonadetes bacterium]|nr:ABC transporter permease [Gemmatimonadota bacterium]
MSITEWRSEVARALRRLRRAPGFAFVVVATLGLGVGANTGIFTVLNAVLLESLPYAEPDRLVRVYEAQLESPGDEWFLRAPMASEYREWSAIFESFATLYTYRELGADLTDGDRPQRVTLLRVSAGYFETLGTPPLLGRTFREDESFGAGESQGSSDLIARVVVVSNGLWTRQFGGDEEIVGRTIRLDDSPYEVVGVMPAGFVDPLGSPADVWLPQDMRAGGSNDFGNFYLSAVARLQPGVSLDQARERARTLAASFGEREADAAGYVPNIVPLHDDIVGGTRARMLWILAVAGILVLFTACLNVANLLLARGLSLDRPLALQSALGAGRGRLITGILAENGLLALGGGVVGIGVAALGLRGLPAIAPDALPRIVDLGMGPRVFGFALLVTVGALLVFGLAPALRLSRTSPADVLRSGDRAATGGRRARRLRDGLVVVQVAAALVLVTGATLLVRSFGALSDVPLAVATEGVLTFEVHLPSARYPEGPDRHTFHERMHERLADLPSVESVGAASWLPVQGRYHIWSLRWPAEEGAVEPGEWTSSDVRIIAGDYFETMGIEVVQGIGPTEVDLEAEPVVWINRAIVDDVFGDSDPLGQLVTMNGSRRVVGIVENVPFNTRGESSRKLYLPHAQYNDDRNWALIQTARAREGSVGLLSEIEAAVAELDGQLVVHRAATFESLVDAARAQDRFAASLMGAFALLALVLALLGTYGVLAGSVNARTREIGIRMALGADSGSIRQMVLRYAAVITGSGVALGLVGARWSIGWLESLLFGVDPTSPWIYLTSAGLFLLVGTVAGMLPAVRATRVDSAKVLSAE